ncbi:MAG: hypothetical protein AB8F78_03115 [Saprospiraceae bacterium]
MLPQSQDDYLDEGFFRAGHTIRKTRFVFVEQDFWSTVWSRVNLKTYALRKSQRKLWNKVTSKFTYTIQPYEDLEDQHQLYHAYQKNHPLDVGQTLNDIFGLHEPTHKFGTHTVRMYDGDELVGFSLFDLGEDSIASLMGCYLPDYASHSLGYFSMLAELNFGRERSLSYYHPGYCVPGVPAFEYKLRLPNLEGKSYINDDWQPMSEVLQQQLPKERLLEKLEALQFSLRLTGVVHERVYTPLYEVLPESQHIYGPFPHPVMIKLTDENHFGQVFVSYDMIKDRYETYIGQAIADLRNELDLEDFIEKLPPNSDLQLFEMRGLIYVSTMPEALATHLRPKPLRDHLNKLFDLD